MFVPNPINPIQIPMWDSIIDDDELREDNIGHDDDDNNDHEENRIDGLLESFYVHDDYDERDDDLERDSMYNSSKTKLYKGINKNLLSAIPLMMNIKSKHRWSDTSFTTLMRYEFYFVL